MTFWPVTGLFLFNLFLPPLGLPRTIRYIKSPDPKAKKIGWWALIVMIVSLVGAVLWGVIWAKNFNNQLNSEMDKYLRMY